MSQSPHMVKDSVSGADYFLRGFSLIRQPGIRTFVRGIVERFRAQTPVISQSEIHPRARLKTVDSI